MDDHEQATILKELLVELAALRDLSEHHVLPEDSTNPACGWMITADSKEQAKLNRYNDSVKVARFIPHRYLNALLTAMRNSIYATEVALTLLERLDALQKRHDLLEGLITKALRQAKAEET